MLKEPDYTIKEKIVSTGLMLKRTGILYKDITNSFPGDIDADVRYFDDVNIWIYLKYDISADDYSRVIEWASRLFGNGGRRSFSDTYGTFMHTFKKEFKDKNSKYQGSLTIDNCHPDNCEIIEKVETRTVFEAKCRGDK